MAQERCVRRNPSQGRLWEMGEVRTCQNFDDDGKPVASPHFRLVEEDERVDPDEVYDSEDLKEKRRESGMRDKSAAIVNALQRLDPDDNTHWTSKGFASTAAVYNIVDFEVSRADIMEAAPDFDRAYHKEAIKQASQSRD